MSIQSIPQEIYSIAKTLSKYKGRSILVGGAVRDHCMGEKNSKDLDVEIFGVEQKIIESVLQKFGQIFYVGKNFGVLKLKTSKAEYDFSLPRHDNKIDEGHRGFLTVTDSNMSFEDASSRRDFTVNSIGYDLLKQKYLDPFNGLEDLRNGIIRHIGPSFSEDPLRVLRAMQLSARLEFEIAPQTIKVCRQLKLSELSKERIFEEFRKLLLKAKTPSIGFEAARKMGILNYFPELKALIGIPQDPEWHPEGDVWTHTLLVINEAAKLRKGIEKKDLELMFAALCHDFGKPITTKFIRGRWRSPSHDSEGLTPTEKFMSRLTNDRALIEKVKSLVKEHLRPVQLYKSRNQINSGTIKRLALRVSIPDLVLLARADYFGRTFSPKNKQLFKAGEWLLIEAKKMNVHKNAPQPILLGRHLLELGMLPGPKMGIILRNAFEKQLNGDLEKEEDAIAWAKSNLNV